MRLRGREFAGTAVGFLVASRGADVELEVGLRLRLAVHILDEEVGKGLVECALGRHQWGWRGRCGRRGGASESEPGGLGGRVRLLEVAGAEVEHGADELEHLPLLLLLLHFDVADDQVLDDGSGEGAWGLMGNVIG